MPFSPPSVERSTPWGATARAILPSIACLALWPILASGAGRPRAVESGWIFHRGINLNGPSVVIDGWHWDGDREAADFRCDDQRFENQRVPLKPPTDQIRARMIRSSRWRADGKNHLTLRSLPRGDYRVFLYNWEDSASQRFSVALEGRVVVSHVESGPPGSWKRLGPLDVTVSDGALEITCRGGHANLSGLELWRRAGPAGEMSPATSSEHRAAGRTRAGLLALYTFEPARGDAVRDHSGVEPPLDLRLARAAAVDRHGGRFIVRSSTTITSPGAATRLVDAVKRSGEITIEAWITTASTRQDGPARIVSLSADPGQRNFTLGQDGSRIDVRLRTTSTSDNGIPSLATPGTALASKPVHVAYTRERSGRARIFVDGREQASGRVSGSLDNWNPSFRLSLANEATSDRPWLGELHLVAVYGRALAPREIEENFRVGTEVGARALAREAKPSAGEQIFDGEVAPLLVRHCLECHDRSTRKGRLDLSRRETALAGGKRGEAIVPGKPSSSLVWKYVEADKMPAKRPPLAPGEKQILRTWIEAGAVWPVEVLDPANYAHDRRAGRIWVQRLTRPEYIETVRRAVGVDIAGEARRLLPRDLRADGFSNTAYNLNIDLKHVDAYSRLAEVIVERMDVARFAARFSGSRKLTDDSMRGLIAKMGKWLLRGPLDEAEIVVFRGISTSVAAAGGDYDEAVRYTLEAMLQSPRFLYRIERQRGDGRPWPVSDHELATRLSYIIWGGPPDRELMRAADDGKLSDRGHVERQVDRMLNDPRAVERSLRFVTEWLDLDRLEHLRPNGERFPRWDPALSADMRRETLAYFEDVVWKEGRPLTALLNAQFTYLTPRLARHYGLTPEGHEAAVEGERRDGTRPGEPLIRRDLASVPTRGGLLTHGSVLTIGGDEASMVSRGLFVLRDLLRGAVNDPPPDVDTTPVPSRPGLSQRAIAERRIADSTCGVCHVRFEPLAFGLERFDGLGSYHEVDEHGNELRDDGEILFPGSEEPVVYDSSAELMNLLATSERVAECLTWKVAQFALGRPLVSADAAALQSIHRRSREEGGTYRSLMTAIVMSDLVQMTRTEGTRE